MSFHPDTHGAFHLMRHGATEYNLRGLRCGGDLDVELTDLGRHQAREAANRVREMQLGVRLIVSSALVRARETASIVSDALGGLPILIEPLLNERRLGEWNGEPVAATEALLRSHVIPPGGETEQAFMWRIARGLEVLVPKLAHQPLVVGSSGIGRVLHTLLGGVGRLRLANAEIVRFRVERSIFPLTIPIAMPKHSTAPMSPQNESERLHPSDEHLS
ncbi:MAG: histidine phosphatase family protein [Burkholderiales bacterium]